MNYLILFIFVLNLNFAKEKVKLKTKVTKETQQNKMSSFTPIDNSFRFKIDPKKVKSIKDSDINTIVNKINSIKSDVFDFKSRLVESKRGLKGVIDVPFANLQINFENDMSSTYRIINLSCLLDGKNIYSNYDIKEQDTKNLDIYNSMVAPGYHEVVIQVVYVGNAEGLFDYLNNYRVKVKSRHSFNVEDGVSYKLTSLGYEKGTIFTSFKDKPNIKFVSKIENHTVGKDKL